MSSSHKHYNYEPSSPTAAQPHPTPSPSPPPVLPAFPGENEGPVVADDSNQILPSFSDTLGVSLEPFSRAFSASTASTAPVQTVHHGDTHDESHALDHVLNSVVKIFCTSTTPNYAMPWQMKRQSSSTSSGFVIDGRRILCNAHGVTNATSIRIRKHGEATKYAATIEHIAHDCDLAILNVKDEKFWSTLTPLEFGDVPRIQDSVVVVGFPTGGDNLSVTKGVVSRIIVGSYTHSGESLLSIQTDSSINSGNSGGPSIKLENCKPKVVGVAFETLSGAQGIGYLIPVPVIKHLLQDIEMHKRYTAYPRLGFQGQKLENPSIRQYLHIPDDQNGILVAQIDPLCPAAEILHLNDVVLAIDGHEIANDGTILFRKGERVSFRHIESMKFVEDSAHLKLVRDGKILEVDVKVIERKALVPLHLHDQRPSYFVVGGLVFIVLSRAYLYHEWGKDWHKKAPVDLVEKAYYGVKKYPDEEVVVLNQVLSEDDVNQGYNTGYHNLIIETVNEIPIRNLRQLVQIVEAADAEDITQNGDKQTAPSPKSTENKPHYDVNPCRFLRIKLSRDKLIIIDLEASRRTSGRIQELNQMIHSKSEDLRSGL